FPGRNVFITRCSGRSVGGYLAIAVTVSAIRRAGDRCRGLRVVARQSAETVLGPEEGGLRAILLGNKITHARAGNEFLALENAAEQQADNHQHDSDLDQRETLILLARHDHAPPSLAPCAMGHI